MKPRKASNARPKNHRNEWGFVAGFPILPNKLFGFVSLDRIDYAGQQNYARDLFLESEIAKPWLTRGNDTPANRAWIEGILGRYPQGAVPNDPRPPTVTSGVRIGSPASTTRGFKEAEMTQVANWIADIIDANGAADVVAKVRGDVSALCRKFPVYGK